NPADFSLSLLAPALPEILLSLLVFALLVIDAFAKGPSRAGVYWLAVASLAATAAACAGMADFPREVSFNGLFIIDRMAQVLKAVTLLTVAATLMLSRSHLEAWGLLTGEFLALAPFCGLGMTVMTSAPPLRALGLGLERPALPQYALGALRRDPTRGSEAGMKYFVLGGLSSGLLLSGLSLVYGAAGSLELGRVAYALEQ